MESIKETLKKFPDRVNQSSRAEFLELAKKDERGIPQSTGVHRVKLLRGEAGKNKDYKTKMDVQGIWLFFEEDGIEKKYFVPTFYTDKNSDKYGKFYYLYEKFADIPEGSLLDIEYVREGMKGYVDVREASGNTSLPKNDLPTINKDDIPVVEDDVKLEDIPY